MKKEMYGKKHTTVEDLIATLEHQVIKTMNNVGCGAKTALESILDEDLFLIGAFCITGAGATPRIEYLD